MTTIETAADGGAAAQPLEMPPGAMFNGVVIAMFIVTIWRGSERTGDLGSILWIALGWFSILLAWGFRFLAGVDSRTVMGPRVRAPIRWALAPSLFAVAAVIVFGGYAFDVRFEVSRPALENAAAETSAGRAPGAGWIGLYPVRRVSTVGGSVRVEVDGQLPFVRDAPSVDDLSSSVWYDPIDDHWSLEFEATSSD